MIKLFAELSPAALLTEVKRASNESFHGIFLINARKSNPTTLSLQKSPCNSCGVWNDVPVSEIETVVPLGWEECCGAVHLKAGVVFKAVGTKSIGDTIASFDSVASRITAFASQNISQEFYIEKSCEFSGDENRQRHQIAMPSGYAYASHSVTQYSQNPNGDYGVSGYAVTVDNSKQNVFVELFAKNHPECFCFIICNGVRAWIHIRVDIVATPIASGPHLEFTFDSGTDAGGGLVELQNPHAPPAKRYASRNLAPNITAAQCATVLNQVAGDVIAQSLLSGAVVKVFGPDIWYRVTGPSVTINDIS
jgi:hypothetical protein